MDKFLEDGKYKEIIKGGSVQLIEKRTKMEVNIKGLPRNGLQIHFDDKIKDRLFPSIISKSEKNYRKICDYLIFLPHKSEIEVYFIEMKKEIEDEGDIRFEMACKQICCTVPIWDYLRSMLETHHNKNPKVKKHYAVIAKSSSTKGVNKQPTKFKQPKPYKNFKLIRYLEREIPLQDLRC